MHPFSLPLHTPFTPSFNQQAGQPYSFAFDWYSYGVSAILLCCTTILYYYTTILLYYYTTVLLYYTIILLYCTTVLPHPVRCARIWLKVAPHRNEGTVPSPTPAHLGARAAPAQPGAQSWQVGGLALRLRARLRPHSKRRFSVFFDQMTSYQLLHNRLPEPRWHYSTTLLCDILYYYLTSLLLYYSGESR